MTFTVDKATFVSSFLQPISKVGESCCINLSAKKAECIATDTSKTMFLYGEAEVSTTLASPIKLNIKDVTKLQRAIECIEEPKPTFTIAENNIQYKSKGVKFKYHLLEDGVLPVPAINISRLLSLTTSTTFSITKQTYISLMRNSMFTSDTSKLYLYTKDGVVSGELNDKTMPNVDTLEMHLADTFTGKPFKSDVIIRLDALRNFAGLKFDQIDVDYVDQNQILILKVKTENTCLRYVISPLTK